MRSKVVEHRMDPTVPFPGYLQDFVVADAQPLPTAKEQCKHRGWAQFGFENQGPVRGVRPARTEAMTRSCAGDGRDPESPTERATL